MIEAAKISHLSNGLTVVTRRQPSEQVYVSLDVAVGARHEKPGQEGMAHFVEHMLVKESKKWNKEERSEKVRDMLGDSNAYTSMENTHYLYHVNKEFVPQALDILSDSMLRTKMPATSVKTEAATIAAEIAMHESGDSFHNIVRGLQYPDSRLAELVIGTTQTTGSFSPTELKKFIRNHYTADRMTLVVVGDVKHEAVCHMAEEKFKGLRRGNGQTPDFHTAQYRGGYKTIDYNSEQESILSISFPLKGRQAGMREVFKDHLVAEMLGGDIGSSLYRSLRTEKGLVYVTGAYAGHQHDTGTLTVEASFLPSNQQAVADTMIQEITRLGDGMSEKYFEQAKKSLLGHTERAEESAKDKANMLASDIRVYGREITLDEKCKLMDSITLDELREHAHQVFSGPPTIAAFGKNATKLPYYSQLTKALGYPRTVGEDGLALRDTKQTGNWVERTGTAKERATKATHSGGATLS